MNRLLVPNLASVFPFPPTSSASLVVHILHPRVYTSKKNFQVIAIYNFVIKYLYFRNAFKTNIYLIWHLKTYVRIWELLLWNVGFSMEKIGCLAPFCFFPSKNPKNHYVTFLDKLQTQCLMLDFSSIPDVSILNQS